MAERVQGERLLRLADIIGDKKRGIPARIPISRSAWYRGVERGDFPAPVKLGSWASAWRESDIDELVANGVASARLAA